MEHVPGEENKRDSEHIVAAHVWDEPTRGEAFMKIEEAIEKVYRRMDTLLEESEVACEAPEPYPMSVEEEPLVPLVTPEIPVVMRYTRPATCHKNTDLKDEASRFLAEVLTPQIPSPAPEFPPLPEPVKEACPIPHDSLKWRVFNL